MSDTTRRLDGLAPETRARLLEKLRQAKQAQSVVSQAIPRRADPNTYPLSFAQQRMWILSQLEPDSPFYNIALALRLTGALDVAALEASLNEILRRHEVLRASFATERGNPVQRIAAEIRLTLTVEDLRAAGADSVERRALALAEEEARTPLDLLRPPLLRARLLKLAENDHVALLTLHHIITDGWSTGVLVREIGLLYEAFIRGAASPLAPLTIQYADYAAWQREQLQGPRIREEVAYWRDELQGIPPLLELPTDRPRPAVQTVAGAIYPFEIATDLAEGLRELARREGATLYQVMLAAYQTLLYRYTGQETICVGTPIANRTRPEVENLIGFFVNTLVMRGDFSGEPSFREALRRLRERALGAQAHQDLPFEMLVDEVAPQRNMSITPIFQVMFGLEQRPSGTLRLPNITLTPIETHSGTSKFDLTLFVADSTAPQAADSRPILTGSFEYNTDLWNATSIARMIGHFRQLLAAIVADPDCSVADLNLLPEAERHQILNEWNDTTTGYPRDKCLHQMFEEQVGRTPDAVAVIYGDEQVTYAELNRRANQVAHCLQSLGVGPEVLVGVYLERSVQMIVALLGIIKAGGAYLPLDVDYPAERLAFMLTDGQVPVLLTQASLAGKLPPTTATVLRMDVEWSHFAAFPTANPVTTVEPGNLAYVIYTSGSTGRPKGVSIPQRAIARLVFNTNYIDLNPADRIAQASNASFDAATFEIWGALLRGARLVGISKETALSAREFVRFLREQGISTLFLTTALFNHIAAEIPDGFATLGHLMFGGEAVDPRWVRQVLHHGPPRRLLHVYGPTESTTFASWYLISEVAADAKTVPIGRPLSNTQIYVLDRHFRPVPLGVGGELCIGGDGLAVGYLHRPDLTAEKFVPNPFATGCSTFECSRLYRTGDLVRFAPDGSIEFLGRIDHQVKVRGFRIELGEVEAVLGRHPAMDQVFVMAREDTLNDRRVVAYAVPKAGQTPTVSELRGYLKEQLPEYMVPAAFVFMDHLPLNPNGKVDRKALPVPDQTRPESGTAYVAPRSPIERFLAQKWQEVLGIERISVLDNFFELGGNSLQAAVLTNRMQEELGTVAHVRALFMAPTIAELAMYLDEYYPDAIGRITGIIPAGADAGVDEAGHALTPRVAAAARVDAAKIAQFEAIIPPLTPRCEPPEATADKNPPAVFVLSPPRSGSTLLRVMLAGNPSLFAPPELDLLSFNTLAERRAAFSGKYQFWLEGPIKAIMELRQCSTAEADAVMAGFEADGWSTKRFYRQLQAWIAESAAGRPRTLVDKTPTYPMDPAVLARMEQDFDGARYIHLMRQPYGTVYSFMEAKLEQIFFRHAHPFSIRELAELVYTVSHRNILAFLDTVPAERQHRVWFEELVGQPEPVMRGICDFLGIDFHPDMLEPYAADRMTSGIRPGDQMVGDFKFYLRNRIDPKAADRWKRFMKGDALSELTWDIASRLGYAKPAAEEPAKATAPVESIQPLPEGATIPLSFAQQRLWFLDQFEPGSPFYNVPAAVRLSGLLHVPALERALNEIVRRHDVLRTTFATVDGIATPMLAPAQSFSLPLPVIDLRGLPADQREPEAQRLAAEEARRPFDLATGPLLRATLVRLTEAETIALVTMHHIVSDGLSVGVFIRELAACYEAFSAGREVALPALPIQYADFAAWQRGWLARDGDSAAPLQQQLAFWKQQLAGLPPLLELPIDRPRPAVQTLNGARHTFVLPQPLSDAIQALSRKEGVTLFMTLLAAYQTLLARYTGQEDIAVGTPIAGRNRPEIQPLIGFFVNTLVMRGNLSGAPTFRELLRRVQATAVKAYEHQDVPFEMLVEELQPQRDMSHTPLFQAMFALQDAPLRTLQMPGLTFSPLQPDTKTAKFDLMLNIIDRPDGLRGALEYNTDLFDASTAARMAGHFQTLLEGIAAAPDTAITALPLLTPAERQTLLVDWNATAADIATAGTIHERFSQQAARTPDAIAIVAEGEAEALAGAASILTFAELDARSNQLAHYLRTRGVGPEQIVGLLTERSLDTLVGLFGILKAGAAYLPLDPAYPADRLAFMLADAGVRVLLTQDRLPEAGGLPRADAPQFQAADGQGPTTIVRLDTDWPAIARCPVTQPPVDHSASHLAYVIYTSGSTGRPKGVMVPHHTALNLAGALHRAAYAHSPLDRPLRLSLNAPLAFDASVQQLVMLTYGHTLVVIPQVLRSDAPALLAFIRRQHLDQLDCVPSQLKLLLAAGLLAPAADWTPSIVFPGGEAIDPATWAALAAAPATDFFNMYGPTECTVDATTACARLAPQRPTIGRPLANTQVYVLDRHQQPVPVGVPGELYVGGAGVSRGYLGRPDLTAERFVPNPFTNHRISESPISNLRQAPGADSRLYRTGDLVRWLPDGTLDFLGRTDFQVKVRGFRIELGEIEAALRRHPALKEAVVLAREDQPGDKRLVAYLVPQPGTAVPSVADLRRHLLADLPEYMVPSAFVPLAALPLTPNAKLDRKALPAPEAASRAELGSAYVAPTTPTERILAAIWARVLGVEQVGTADNFFELGGDSILTIQVIAAAAQAGLHLTPKQLFQAPTIAELAVLAELAPVSAVPAEQGPVMGPLPLTPIQNRFFEIGLDAPSHWNQSLLLSVRGRLQPEAMRRAVTALLDHHDALRLRFTPSTEGWQQTNVGPEAETPFTYCDLAAQSTAERAQTLRAEILRAQTSLDITHGPLFRVVYLDYGAETNGRLLIVIHHLAIDRVSWRILLEDLGAAYEQTAQRQPVTLPAKTTAFRDWARRLVEYAQSPTLQAEAAYWLNLGAEPAPALPLDFPGGTNHEANTRTLAAFLDETETQALLKDAPPVYGTDVNEILLTALTLAFGRWTGTPRLLVEIEGHGRQDDLFITGRRTDGRLQRVDLSRTVGWFTTIHPVRLAVAADSTLGDALKTVKEQLRSVPQGGIGYGLLRYLCHDPFISSQIATLTRPQISYNYLGQFVQGAEDRGAFSPAPESSGPDHAPENRRPYMLDVTASVFQGRLRAEWTYSDQLHRATTIETLSAHFMAALRALISHCLSPEAGGYTLSDFAGSGLSQDDFEGLFEELGELND